MAGITLKVDGAVQLSRNLRVFADGITKLKPFFVEAVDIVHKRSDELFENKGQNVEKGPKWKPLSSSTLKARSRRTGYYAQAPNKPSVLRWTGRLQEDVTEKADDRSGSFGFNAPYAIEHHKGGGRLPKRPLIDLNNETNTKITKALQKEIHRQIGIFGKQR